MISTWLILVIIFVKLNRDVYNFTHWIPLREKKKFIPCHSSILANVYGKQAVNLSIIRRWDKRFKSNDGDEWQAIFNKAVIQKQKQKKNEVQIDLLICANRNNERPSTWTRFS